MKARKITRIALLGAILYVSQVVLSGIPNAELVSLLIVCYTLCFGKETYLTVTVFTLFEGLQWGFGLWWVSYLYVWPVLVTMVLSLKSVFKEDFFLWSVVSGVYGLIFGALFAIAYIPIDMKYALTYWISGIPWDVWHGIVNFIVMMVLGKNVYKALRRVSLIEK